MGFRFPQWMWKSSSSRVFRQGLFSHFCIFPWLPFCAIRAANHYAEHVSPRPLHPPIPAEALARQARLAAALRAVEEKGASLEPRTLQALRVAFGGTAVADMPTILAAIQAEDLVEEAAELLRSARREVVDLKVLETLTQHLTPLAAKARQRRSALWQLDTRRALVRWTFVKEHPALGFDDGDIHALFLHACRLEGLRLALDLGKRPRPLLNLGCPLPVGVGGVAEFMDAVLRQEPAEGSAAVMTRLNQRLPEGLSIMHWDVLPVYASEVGELALASHWQWDVAADRRRQVEQKVTAFLETATWPWRRDVDTSAAALDLRSLITGMDWKGHTLCFSTRMGPTKAVNPLKVLGDILGMEPGVIEGLVRTSVDLKPDARLVQAERFEPKLKNMYEDAVLLGGSSNITLIDEDDDEPIRLG